MINIVLSFLFFSSPEPKFPKAYIYIHVKNFLIQIKVTLGKMRSNYMYIYMDVIEENLVLKKIWMV